MKTELGLKVGSGEGSGAGRVLYKQLDVQRWNERPS